VNAGLEPHRFETGRPSGLEREQKNVQFVDGCRVTVENPNLTNHTVGSDYLLCTAQLAFKGNHRAVSSALGIVPGTSTGW
jgi:hypothetical protein